MQQHNVFDFSLIDWLMSELEEYPIWLKHQFTHKIIVANTKSWTIESEVFDESSKSNSE
jgi:hypothetical protein